MNSVAITSKNKMVNYEYLGEFFFCWIMLHELKYFRLVVAKKKKTWAPFIVIFPCSPKLSEVSKIIIFLVISCEAKNEQFHGGVRQKKIFFVEILIFQIGG